MAMTTAPTDLKAIAISPAGVEALACLFRGFAEPTRLAIIEQLLHGEQRVVDLTVRLGMAQSTISGHLACLVDCGIAMVRPQGRSSWYSVVDPEEIMDLLGAARHLAALTGEHMNACETFGAGRADD